MSGPVPRGPGLAAGAPSPESASASAPAPAFVVRESARARHVRLVMTVGDGLVVVVPRGFDRGEIPEILERKRSWIERTADRVGARQGESATEDLGALPQGLQLRFLGTEWAVEYAGPRGAPPWEVASRAEASAPGMGASAVYAGTARGAAGASAVRASAAQVEAAGASAAGDRGGKRTVVREHPGRRLVVHGCREDGPACRKALRRWLVRKARTMLVPRLVLLADERGFAFGSISVRMQRTRWASCSGRKTISLNAKLLFLPPDLVDYVLLHELCHTVRPDHSAAYWTLLSKYEPDYRAKRLRMREAHRFVPRWFEERVSRSGTSGPSALP